MRSGPRAIICSRANWISAPDMRSKIGRRLNGISCLIFDLVRGVPGSYLWSLKSHRDERRREKKRKGAILIQKTTTENKKNKNNHIHIISICVEKKKPSNETSIDNTEVTSLLQVDPAHRVSHQTTERSFFAS